MISIASKIKELGFDLPKAPTPVASYVSAVRAGNLLYTSGMLPVRDGHLIYTGKVGGLENAVEIGYAAARLCLLNALSVIQNMVGLDNVEQVVKLTGYVNSANCFYEQPKVINGASDLLVQVFGEAGKHARAAIGVSELPLNAAVEVDLIVQIK